MKEGQSMFPWGDLLALPEISLRPDFSDRYGPGVAVSTLQSVCVLFASSAVECRILPV